jgi:hypothetical protein
METVCFPEWCLHCVSGLIAAMVCWADPFPLIHHANGDLSISPWHDRVFIFAVCASLATIVCAVSGRGPGRIILSIAGALLLVASCCGWLQNSV